MNVTRTYTLGDLTADIPAAVVSCWYVAEGGAVAEDDDLLDLLTDKATVTVPAPASGMLARQLAACDCEITKDTPLFSIRTND
jgi:pyruvate/2-oxoglutarate dehydrogenase complex dihydrolipoamide acyltransferase (E2) component